MMPTGPRGILVSPDFVRPRESVDLLAFLADVPEREASQFDPESEFAFCRPVYNGAPIRGRWEGAAGWPIFVDGFVVSGPSIPALLADLRDRVLVGVEELLP